MDEKEISDVMNDEWRTRGGSIWNQNRQPSTTRVKCRATTCQLVQLVKFMEKHKELAVSHTQPFPGSEQLWEELADHINQFGPPKNPKQCKTTWRDLRKRAFAMMRSRSKDKQKSAGRNLYGMAPKIISLIAAAGGLPKTSLKGITVVAPPAEAGSSKAVTPKVLTVDKSKEQGVMKVERTSSGDKLVIRVTNKQNSKSNVLNSFSVSDGHFENNIIVKEERDDHQADEADEAASETSEPEEERGGSVSDPLFTGAEELLRNQDSRSSRDVCKALKMKYVLMVDNMTACEKPQPPYRIPPITAFECTIRKHKGKTFISGRNTVFAEIPFQNLSITSYTIDASGARTLMFHAEKLPCRSFFSRTFLERGRFRHNPRNCRLLKGSASYGELDMDKIAHGIPHWHSEGTVLHETSLVANGETVYCVDALVSIKSIK